MEEIDFLIDTSLGEVDVTLYADGWGAFTFTEQSDDPVMAEVFVKGVDEVAEGLTTLGLPAAEAVELAEELWDELDENEQRERARLGGGST
ncbi:MAG: hypothetical protein ACRDKT_10990 [Actinomycetota bacterium]